MAITHQNKSVLVYANWHGIESPVLMGNLHATLLRGKEIFSFSYDDAWLKTNTAQMLDPDLQLYTGQQYLNSERNSNFGIFLDSSPDRWGRVLMRRREAALARKENRPVQNLFESDYLLGVFDGHRMGGLRFKTAADGPFLNDNKEMASPPWASIRTLEEISLKLEDDKIVDNPNYLHWLNMLVAPGSSLGGVRPKASIIDKENNLWIAKFPSKNDHGDIGGWEMVVHDLAVRAGINMARGMAQKFSSKHHTFLSQRFDRTADGERIHFASALTLLGYSDGQDAQDGVSYLELVEFITSSGANVKEDLHELWRRIVFSICVSNVDDHLRNHGFMLVNDGWRLSPAYDINPVETGIGLKLNITEDENALDMDLAIEVHPYFRLSNDEAFKIINEIKEAVRHWRDLAHQRGFSTSEIERKAGAFQNAQ